jgi:hypothetical protein
MSLGLAGLMMRSPVAEFTETFSSHAYTAATGGFL